MQKGVEFHIHIRRKRSVEEEVIIRVCEKTEEKKIYI